MGWEGMDVAVGPPGQRSVLTDGRTDLVYAYFTPPKKNTREEVVVWVVDV